MLKQIRVLYLEPTALVSGGSIALLRVITALDRRRFRPLVVLGSEGPLLRQFKHVPGCRVIALPFPPRLAAVTRNGVMTGAILTFVEALKYALRVRSIANRWKADIVHSNGLKMHFLSALGVSRRRRLVWHIRDFISRPYMPERTAWLVRHVVRRIPDVAICNSESTRASLLLEESVVIESGISAGGTTLRTVPDGISRSRVVDVDGITERLNRVVMLGRLAAWKGQHVFVEAAKRLCVHDAVTEFIIAGEPTNAPDALYAKALRASVEQGQYRDRIRFVGTVHDVPGLLATTDLLVHCSTSPEPFGQVILEGMAAGVAVVASDIGGPTEIIQENVNGRLTPPGDDRALAETIRELLDDSETRARLAENGRRTVVGRFGIERTVQRLTSIYDELMQTLTSNMEELPRAMPTDGPASRT